MLRRTLAIVGGLVLANLVVFGIEALDSSLYPAARAMPASGDARAWQAFMAGLPAGALALVVVGWTAGVFAGAALAARVALRGEWPGWAVTALFMAAAIWNFVAIPHPRWMVVAGVVLILGGGWLGARIGARRRLAA